MSVSSLELGEVLHQLLSSCKQPGGQPNRLPALFLGKKVPNVSQLLHDLTVHLVLQDLVLEGIPEYLDGQLIAGPGPPGG